MYIRNEDDAQQTRIPITSFHIKLPFGFTMIGAVFVPLRILFSPEQSESAYHTDLPIYINAKCVYIERFSILLHIADIFDVYDGAK